MKRFFVAILIVVMVFVLFGCVAPTRSETTSYDIDIKLNNMTLDIDENISYVNNTDWSLERLRLVSYVGAYTDKGNVANRSSLLSYPFGVNYADLDIRHIKVDGKDAKVEVVDEMYRDIVLDKPLNVGSCIDISISYSETLPKNRMRYGYNETSINIGNAFIRVMPLYNGEYTSYPYALNGDPFYDEVACFDVHLECDKKYDAVTTGRRAIKTKGDKIIIDSKADRVRDYAIVLSDRLSTITDEHNGVNIEYMTGNRDNAVYISTIKKALDTFNNLFGKYPYDNIAVVLNDFVEGGMEYPMLIYVNKDMSEATLEKVIVHELAHQWWYGVVGDNENVDYMIDEGMAELSTYLYYLYNGEEAYANALMKMTRNDYMSYLAMDGTENQMNVPLDKIGDRQYYAMAYLKSPLLLYDVMNRMGRDAFIETLRRIYSRYAFRNITLNDFLTEFGDMGEYMREYIEGKTDFE